MPVRNCVAWLPAWFVVDDTPEVSPHWPDELELPVMSTQMIWPWSRNRFSSPYCSTCVRKASGLARLTSCSSMNVVIVALVALGSIDQAMAVLMSSMPYTRPRRSSKNEGRPMLPSSVKVVPGPMIDKPSTGNGAVAQPS